MYDMFIQGSPDNMRPLGKSVKLTVHWISLSTWDLGLEEIRAISDFAL